MNIAIVHDYLNQFGGAERCVAAMLEAFPNADLYTSLYFPDDTFEAFRRFKVRTSFMQNIPGIRRHYRKYFMLYPRAFEKFDFRGYDVLISSSSAFAKFAIPGAETLHLCYCYTPMRFAWQFESYISKESWPPGLPKVVRPLINKLRSYDLKTLNRVHRFCTISKYVRSRIASIYGHPADVIYPPVDVERFFISERPENYYLVVSRLAAHKRVDIAVEAFNRLGLPLKIVGSGPQLNTLKSLAKKNIEFLRKTDDLTLSDLYANCRALIVPSIEEFGISSLEAMASGRPVIAFRGGGVLETVIPHEPHLVNENKQFTGLFFSKQSADSLREALGLFEQADFKPEVIRSYAMQFDKRSFIEKLKDYVAEQWGEFSENHHMRLELKEKVRNGTQ